MLYTDSLFNVEYYNTYLFIARLKHRTTCYFSSLVGGLGYSITVFARGNSFHERNLTAG
jgi:hypothetical protein